MFTFPWNNKFIRSLLIGLLILREEKEVNNENFKGGNFVPTGGELNFIAIINFSSRVSPTASTLMEWVFFSTKDLLCTNLLLCIESASVPKVSSWASMKVSMLENLLSRKGRGRIRFLSQIDFKLSLALPKSFSLLSSCLFRWVWKRRQRKNN